MIFNKCFLYIIRLNGFTVTVGELEDMYKVGRQAFRGEITSVKYTEKNVPMYCSDIAMRAVDYSIFLVVIHIVHTYLRISHLYNYEQ